MVGVPRMALPHTGKSDCIAVANTEGRTMKRQVIGFIFVAVCLHAMSGCQTEASKHFGSGNAKFKSEDYRGAVADFTKVIELNPNDLRLARAYCNRGNARGALGDYSGAIEDVTKSLSLQPGDFASYAIRGYARTMAEPKDYQGAIADFTKVIELKPDYAFAFKNRGVAYLHIGKKDKALADFARAIELGVSISQETLDQCK